MEKKDSRAGRCACGACRIEVAGDPIITHACHCTYCQRESGSAFALNCVYEAGRVAIEGPAETVVVPSQSGEDQWMVRCGSCGTVLSGHYRHAREKLHFVRAGVLDHRATIAPDVHIHTSTKMDWVILGDEIPVFEGFYDARTFWSEEQMRRWKAAAKR